MKAAQDWVFARVVSTHLVTPTVQEFCIEPSGGALPYAPGAHLQMHILVNGKPQTRSYSLLGEPNGKSYRFAVKYLPEGRGGSVAMWRLSVGDQLEISAPLNHFPLDLTAPAYFIAAGGIGITPLLWMAQRLKTHALASGVPIRMVYGARTADELAFLPLLRDCLGDALHTFVASDGQTVDYAAEIATLPEGTHLYTCGPVPMLETIKRAWFDAKRPVADLRFETFGSSGRLPTRAFDLRVPRHGLAITVPSCSSLLDELELAGVPAIYDCRRGECGLCVMDVLAIDGEIDHRDVFLSAEEKMHNKRICVCVSRAVGIITLESAYRPEIA